MNELRPKQEVIKVYGQTEGGGGGVSIPVVFVIDDETNKTKGVSARI